MFLLQKLYILSVLLILSSVSISAQGVQSIPEQTDSTKDFLTVEGGFQFWNIYTIGHKLYDESKSKYSEAYNGWNSLIRRARLNIKFQPFSQLSIQGNFSADQLGKDDNSTTQGGKANSSNSISVLDLYARYHIMKSSDCLVLTFGLQRPILGRETIVSSLRTSSLEKSISQYYQRKQIVGSGNGRTVGVNIGGQYIFSDQTLLIKYTIGTFATPSFNLEGDRYSSPLFTGRIGIDIGDPESSSYSTSSKTNYFGGRNGLTISTSFSYQDSTSLFDRATSFGFDFLFNSGYLNVDGEIFVLYREMNVEQTSISSTSKGGYFRVGYSIKINKKQYLEPVLMYTLFSGGTSLDEIITASQLTAFSGSDKVLEIGFNYYLSSLIKLSLFYTDNNGDNEPHQTTNNFNRVDSLGRDILRGDQLAIAITINI